MDIIFVLSFDKLKKPSALWGGKNVEKLLKAHVCNHGIEVVHAAWLLWLKICDNCQKDLFVEKKMLLYACFIFFCHEGRYSTPKLIETWNGFFVGDEAVIGSPSKQKKIVSVRDAAQRSAGARACQYVFSKHKSYHSLSYCPRPYRYLLFILVCERQRLLPRTKMWPNRFHLVVFTPNVFGALPDWTFQTGQFFFIKLYSSFCTQKAFKKRKSLYLLVVLHHLFYERKSSPFYLRSLSSATEGLSLRK